MSAIKKIFVSSSFHESFEFGFNDERKLLKDKINGEDDLTDNSLDHGHPEASQGTEEASLQRVGESQLVVFLLGRRYGTIRENGLSLTHEEYNEAVRLNKPKLCYEFPINPSDEDYEVCLEFREQIKKKDDCIVLNIEDEIKKGNFSSVFSEVVKKKSAGEKQEPNEVEKKDYALDLANKILHDIIRQFKNTRYRSFQSVPPIPEDYFPRDTHIEAIKEKLEKNKGVVVSGMSGIGKTTLSIILGNDNNLKNDFKDGIYYLKMGQDPDLEDKQNDLLSHLENSNSKGTLKEIIKQDFADRKALLILDDVWVFEHFLPFNITKQETRSKIIITTRYGGQKFRFSEYLIEQLNEDESLAMLKQKIGWSTTDSELETICKRMSKKCGGLPLAISALARVLATDENLKRCQDVENDFETILEKIPADEENRTVYASFQLSVRYLDEETKNRYFSLSILFNKHYSFCESETLRVYWGDNSWSVLDALKEASLLTEQISRKGIKQYALHDLQKTFIKEKTKEQDLTNYKKQFIQNYQKKYAPDWHKIPFYEQNNFYRNYLEICKDLNEQNLAKEISRDILYKNPNIELPLVHKVSKLLNLKLRKESAKILDTNQNSRVVILLLRYLEPPKQKTYAQNYLKEAALKAESIFVTEKCIEILGTDDEQVRIFALNYFKEAALKAESDYIIKKCVNILGTDDEQVRTFALNYLKEPALKAESSFVTKKCIEILGTDDEQVRTFAQNYLKEPALKDGNSNITIECVKILGTDDEQVRIFALNYFKEAALKDGNSNIIIECVKILGTDDEQVRTFALNYLKEPALKAESSFVTEKCIEILGTNDEQVRTFAQNYLKEAALKDGNRNIIIECVKILGTDDEQVRTFAQNYLKEPALKAESDYIIKKCVNILGTDDEQVRTFAQNYLKEPALKDKNGFVTEKCIEILGTDDEQVRTFAQNYLKEPALPYGNRHIIKKCVNILGTDDELRKDIANGYLEKAIKQDFEAVNSDIIIQCFKELDKELRKDFANGYLEKAIKQDFEGVKSRITAECFKEADEELRKDFADGYLEKAIKQDFEAVSKAITAECFKEADEELRKDFVREYFKYDFKNINDDIIRCFKELDKELRKDFANGYLEKAIKQDFESVNSLIITQCFKEADKELIKNFVREYFKYDFKNINDDIILYLKEADKELRKDFANGYLEKAIKQGFEGVNSKIITQCFKEAGEELRKDFANGYLEKAIKQGFEGVNSDIIKQCFKELDKELRKDFANGYLKKAIKQDFESVNSLLIPQCFKELDKELRKDFMNGYLEKAIKQDFEGVNSEIIIQCFKEADKELIKDFANGYLEKAIKQDFEAVNSLIITQCFKEVDEELRKDFINKYFLLDFDKIDENIIRVCFKFVEKNNQRAIDYAENYIKKGNYNNIFTLNSCLAFFPEDNQIRKDFAEKELKKINKDAGYLASEMVTKAIIIQTKTSCQELREKIATRQLKFEFYASYNKYKFPSYIKFSVFNRSLINACLLVFEEQEKTKEYAQKILQHWENEINIRYRGKYYHAHIITALNHPLIKDDATRIAKQILKKDNDELCKNIEDKDFYFISLELDDALQEILQKHILTCKKDIIESKDILELLQETEAIRKKFFEINPEYKTVAYTQSLNTLSYFHQIHNQQKEAISYKQKATNLAEKICEENPNEILIERQAQYKAELQELTNENTEKNATD